MAVKFISNIKENGLGGWCIELLDTVDNRKVICNNIKEYEDAIEQMGDDYGGDIEVIWQKDDNVTTSHMEEVRMEISKYQKIFDNEALK
jgi:predicted RNA-binding protein